MENWLRASPGIKVIARDRSRECARRVAEAAPKALQVADRWHLLLNLRQMLERLLSRLYQRLKQLPVLERAKSEASLVSRRGRFPGTSDEQQASRISRFQRMALYEEIQCRRLAGHNIRQTADELDIRRATVCIHYHADGCENASQLWLEIQTLGYPGSRRRVFQWMQLQRRQPTPTTPKECLAEQGASLPLTITSVQEVENSERLSTVKKLAFLLIRDRETLAEKEMMTLWRIFQKTAIERVYSLAQGFVEMIRHTIAAMLDPWLNACL